MERLTKWEDLIERILEKYMAARSDDRVLYYWILRELGFDTGISLSFFHGLRIFFCCFCSGFY